jgi:integrase
MASIYKRDRSPFWWVEFVDATGKRKQQSTNLRYDCVAQTRQARQRRDDLSALEATAKATGNSPEIWRAWVKRFLSQRYGATATGARAEQAWHNLAAYLDAAGIAVPRQLTRQQVRDFIEWRNEARAEAGIHKGAKNTALLEVKFLSLIMDEAVASGFANNNPCTRLGIGRDEPKRKARITYDEHRLIVKALKLKPEWMRVSYKIAWEQGCRFSETMFALSDVDFARNVIGLRTKGKKESVAEVPLMPGLRPLLLRLSRQGREYTFQKSDLPKGGDTPTAGAAKAFWKFFRKIGLPHLSFHSTRVTFITRCKEAELPEEDAMRLCLHASTTVHRTYPRLPAAGRYLQSRAKMLARSSRQVA